MYGHGNFEAIYKWQTPSKVYKLNYDCVDHRSLNLKAELYLKILPS